MCSDSLKRPQPDRDHAVIEQCLWDALLHRDDVQFDWTDPSLSPTESMSTVQENPEATIGYPWNPADPHTAEFFDKLEDRFQTELQGWDEVEFETRTQTFLTTLDQLWAATDTQTKLAQRFGSRIPQALLTAITRNASGLASQAISLADQLVQSVQDLIPGMAPDDLYVLARPLAYTMRDGSGVDSVLAKVRPVEWDQLNEMEQARLSLAIARCALAEIEQAD